MDWWNPCQALSSLSVYAADACLHYRHVHLTCTHIPRNRNVVAGSFRNFWRRLSSSGYGFQCSECERRRPLVLRRILRGRPHRGHSPSKKVSRSFGTRPWGSASLAGRDSLFRSAGQRLTCLSPAVHSHIAYYIRMHLCVSVYVCL